MNVKTLKSTVVRTAQIAVLALATTTGVGFGAALAAPAFSIEREYFSDATYNVTVGGSGITCGANQWGWGERTEYVLYYYESCA
ncbi:DUF6289 family protein [Brevundimonas lenta]|uniref:Uncharacterized protein n=1 Tax=Brevundimonas lenta TaxID=424796 RepID=A0A7W6JFP2_9CAUL|nr:DUF6289 family protein [Brevundimonas lenta]MBB4083266.1 hypothetical protein [Brevundimonas lenta]